MIAAAALLDGVLSLPASAHGGRALADPDEDAVTLAAEAVLPLLERCAETPRAIVLATTSPPYDEGGSVQVLAEIVGLAGERVALELTSSLRDGLVALRVAAALVAAGDGPVVVAASHVGRGEPDAGDGGAAVLVGSADGVASVRPERAEVAELRDRWRLAGASERAEGDPSFVWAEGAPRVARAWQVEGAAIVGASAKPASRAEHALGGPGDPLAAVGVLGAAHPLARILVSLDAGGSVLAAGGGLAELVTVEPHAGAGAVAAAARAVLEAPRSDERPAPIDWSQLEPYHSGPRGWRERGQELRLEAVRCTACGRVVYPQQPTCPSCNGRELEVVRLARSGVVVTETRDRVYPAGAVTGMAVVDLDGGGRFYGQVVPSAQVAIGDRVRLVPRRLHDGGGAAQYFWKVAR